MRYVVYCHTNRLTGKSYVGVTKTSLEERWRGHLSDAQKGSAQLFHKAIRKHGLDAWDHYEIETHARLADAFEAESFFIGYLGTLMPSGYNMTRGGRGTLHHRFTGEQRARLSETRKKQWRVHRESIVASHRRRWAKAEERRTQSERFSGDRNPMAGRKYEGEKLLALREYASRGAKVANKVRWDRVHRERVTELLRRMFFRWDD